MSTLNPNLPPGPFHRNGQWWAPYKQNYRTKQTGTGKGEPVLVWQFTPTTPPPNPHLLAILQETIMAFDLSTIEQDGEKFLITVATEAAEKARPTSFTDQDQANLNAAIAAAVTFGAGLVIRMFSGKISSVVSKAETAVTGAVTQTVTASPTAATATA